MVRRLQNSACDSTEFLSLFGVQDQTWVSVWVDNSPASLLKKSSVETRLHVIESDTGAEAGLPLLQSALKALSCQVPADKGS